MRAPKCMIQNYKEKYSRTDRPAKPATTFWQILKIEQPAVTQCRECSTLSLTKNLVLSFQFPQKLNHKETFNIKLISKSLFQSRCLSVHPCVRSSVRHKIFFSHKMPWNHSLTHWDHHSIPWPQARLHFQARRSRATYIKTFLCSGHVYAFGRGVAELRISKPFLAPGTFTLLGEAQPSYVYQHLSQLQTRLLFQARLQQSCV